MARKRTLADVLEEYGRQVTDDLRVVMEDTAGDVVTGAKSRVPVRTGRLRDSIRWRWNKNHTVIRIDARAVNPRDKTNYAKIVEFSPKINKPFLYPALDEVKDAYRARMVETLRRSIRKAGGKGIELN